MASFEGPTPILTPSPSMRLASVTIIMAWIQLVIHVIAALDIRGQLSLGPHFGYSTVSPYSSAGTHPNPLKHFDLGLLKSILIYFGSFLACLYGIFSCGTLSSHLLPPTPGHRYTPSPLSHISAQAVVQTAFLAALTALLHSFIFRHLYRTFSAGESCVAVQGFAILILFFLASFAAADSKQMDPGSGKANSNRTLLSPLEFEDPTFALNFLNKDLKGNKSSVEAGFQALLDSILLPLLKSTLLDVADLGFRFSLCQTFIIQVIFWSVALAISIRSFIAAILPYFFSTLPSFSLPSSTLPSFPLSSSSLSSSSPPSSSPSPHMALPRRHATKSRSRSLEKRVSGSKKVCHLDDDFPLLGPRDIDTTGYDYNNGELTKDPPKNDSTEDPISLEEAFLTAFNEPFFSPSFFSLSSFLYPTSSRKASWEKGSSTSSSTPLPLLLIWPAAIAVSLGCLLRKAAWVLGSFVMDPTPLPFRSRIRIWILGYWILCLAVAVPLLLSIRKDPKRHSDGKNPKTQASHKKPPQKASIPPPPLSPIPHATIVTAHSIPLIVVRKGFHLLALFIFAPVYFLDPKFLQIAAAIAFSLLLILESLRCSFKEIKTRVDQEEEGVEKEPKRRVVTRSRCSRFLLAINNGIHDSLESVFGRFIDERDGGPVYITHLTLLLGIALPLWMNGADGWESEGTKGKAKGGWIIGLSGLVILGVGDTVAAVVGKLCGRWRMFAQAGNGDVEGVAGRVDPGEKEIGVKSERDFTDLNSDLSDSAQYSCHNKKTIEGTVAGAGAMMMTWILIVLCVNNKVKDELIPWMGLTSVTLFFGALLEASTSLLDNLIVPPWYLAHLLLLFA